VHRHAHLRTSALQPDVLPAVNVVRASFSMCTAARKARPTVRGQRAYFFPRWRTRRRHPVSWRRDLWWSCDGDVRRRPLP
jgi:hypothetical protein